MSVRTGFTPRIFSAMGAICLMLAGCAGYQAHQEGTSLIANGNPVGGVQKLKEAMQLSPNDPGYRSDYYIQRDFIISGLLRDADSAISQDQFDIAKTAYERVRQLDPSNARGQQGVIRVDVAIRRKARLDAADRLAKAGDYDGALTAVHDVLLEDPNQPQARALQRTLNRQKADESGKESGIYPRLKASYRKPVTLTLNNATVLQVFEALKLASGLNFIFDKDVKTDARITLQVTNKPAEDIIRIVMASSQLERRVLDEDTLLIYPNTPQKAADYRELVVKSFFISNADVRVVANLLKTIVKPRDLFTDEKLNIITVRDSAEVIRLAEKLVATSDVSDAEVVLELEVLEVATNKLQQVGIQWPSSVSASIQGASGTPGQLTLGEFRNRNAGLVNLKFSDPLVAAQFLETSGDSDLLANPRIRVRNRETAKVLIGQRVPIITTASTANVGTSESISYLDVGLKLEFEPTVSLDQEVSMKVALEVSSIISTVKLTSGAQAYTLGTRNASTVLRVKDNETQILAGLIQRDRTSTTTGVPYLSELPLLNRLFGQNSDSGTKTEVILLITPHIVKSVQIPGAEQTEILSGTESSMGAAPIQLGRPGASVAPGRPPQGVQQPPNGQTQQVQQQVPPPPGTDPNSPPGARQFVPPGMVPTAPGTMPQPPAAPQPMSNTPQSMPPQLTAPPVVPSSQDPAKGNQ